MVRLETNKRENDMLGILDYRDWEYTVTIKGEEETFVINCIHETTAYDELTDYLKKKQVDGDTIDGEYRQMFKEGKYYAYELHDCEVSAFRTVRQAAKAIAATCNRGAASYGWWSVGNKVNIEKVTKYFKEKGGPYYLGNGVFTYSMNYPTKHNFGSGILPVGGLRWCEPKDLLEFYDICKDFLHKMYIAIEMPCKPKKIITSRIEVTTRKELLHFIKMFRAMRQINPDLTINFTRFEAKHKDF